MDIKMIVSDLDRTLLRSDKTISNYTADVLKRCRERGIKVAFATARPGYGVKTYLKEISVDATIVQNGSGIYAGKTMLANYTIPSETAVAFYKKLVESAKGFAFSAQTLKERYMNTTRASFTTALDAATNKKIIVFDDDSFPVVPFNNMSLRRIDFNTFKKISRDFPTLRYYFTTGEDLIDIHPIQASKWNATQKLAEHFRVAVAEITAFGDDFNDIEMIQNCGTGIAVSNARNEVKAVADFICNSNDSDGVAKWLEANLL